MTLFSSCDREAKIEQFKQHIRFFRNKFKNYGYKKVFNQIKCNHKNLVLLSFQTAERQNILKIVN